MTAGRRYQLTAGTVLEVEKDSLGQYVGIRPQDRIISVNGNGLRDELDFRFYSAENEIALHVVTPRGLERIIEIEKDPDDYLGLTFENPIFDQVKTCRNHCIFCFIRQIPRDMREPLHIRDDDYRLSFLLGNFVTLTNLDEEDWARLEEQRLSPLRVSVHATSPDVRVRLMRNPEAARIMEHLSRLAAMGIRLHIQIVLLRGINDGPVLERTLQDSESLGEAVVSVGVVPAVYTRYRQDIPSPPGDGAWARQVLDLIEAFARETAVRREEHWVYGADELYLLAGREFPPYEYYGEFHQYENGIGMVPDFRHSLTTVQASPGKRGAERKCIAVTGMLAAPEIERGIEHLSLGPVVSVCKVPNVFFGDSVTVAGLLTGQDILASVLKFLRSENENRQYGRKYGAVLVPSVALTGGTFLDGMTPDHIQAVTGLSVLVTEPTPEGLVEGVRMAAGEA